MSNQISNNKKKVSKPKNTCLTDVMNFPADPKAMKEEIQKRLNIDNPVAGTVPNSNPPINYHRLNLGVKNLDGTEGDLIIDLDRCFSFGTGEGKAPDSGLLNGYSTSISMYDRDAATERQVRTVQFISLMSEVIKEYLLQEDIKAAMENWELEAADLKKLNPLYYRKDKGKIIEGGGATFYPKLIWYKAGKDKNGKERAASMRTKYYLEDEVDENGDQVEVDPLDFMGVRHYITAAVKFESVFMGAKTKNIQCKVYEAEVKAADTGPKRLLKVQAARAPTVIINGQNPLLKKAEPKEEAKAVEVKSESKPVVISKELPPSESLPEDENLQATDEEEEEEDRPKKKKVIKKKVVAAKKQ